MTHQFSLDNINFKEDLKKGQRGEAIVKTALENLTSEYTFTNVANVYEYRHKGDIIAKDSDSHETMIEVKYDSYIGRTRQVVCEELVYYDDTGCFRDGYMYSDYEIFCVVAEDTREIFVIDFSVLKSMYKQFGFQKTIDHPAQYSEVYLVSLNDIERKGGLIATIGF